MTDTEELRGRLLKMREGAAEMGRMAEEALALLPSPDAPSRGYEGDVVGHLRDIAGIPKGDTPDVG